MNIEVVDRGDEVKEAEAKAAADAKAAEEAAKAAEGAKAKEKDEDEDEEGAKRIRIPKARLDEVTRKAKETQEALQKRIDELESETAKNRMSADFQALRDRASELGDKYEDLISDGKIKEAKEVRKELENVQMYMIDALAGAKATAAQREAVADIKYDMLLSQLEAEHDILNPESDKFDEDVANEVYDTMNRLVHTGISKDKALARAVKYVVGTAKSDKKDVDKTENKRGEEARRKTVEAVKATPANLAKHGNDSDKAGGGVPDAASILRMNQDEFAKLDEQTKARLRGDEL